MVIEIFGVDDLKAQQFVGALLAAAQSDGQTASPRALTPDPKIAQLLNICTKTIRRWEADPDLGFPPAIEIKGRRYRDTHKFQDFLAARLKASLAKRKTKNRPAGEVAGEQP
jgi:hypothetical protein